MYAIKFEAAGIQDYIFSSNRLKVNLGASYIIEHLLYKELLKEVCIKLFKSVAKEEFEAWFNDEIGTLNNSQNFRIGYIGGGNALLFASKEDKLEELDEEFKLGILQHFPGLEIYSAISKDNFQLNGDEQNNYNDQLRALNKQLNEHRSAHPFHNKTLNHGFYKHCGISGGPAMREWREGDDLILVSDTVYSKMQYCRERKTGEAPANAQHKSDLLEDQNSNYSFPMEFEHLSKKSEKAYLAVVHIDGNNMGQQFIDANNLDETQELSAAVRDIGTHALKQTIKEGIVDKIEGNAIGDLQFMAGTIRKDNGEEEEDITNLPIRPIITGGDDITFVCEGTLGIPLAKLFLKKFHEAGKKSPFGEVHACAGVAIVKQKYPFSKAYQLSEELMAEAKKPSRGVGNNGSYISIMVAGYGTGSSLQELKAKYGKSELFSQCYKVLGGGAGAAEFEKLEDLIKKLKNDSGFARNKIMLLRESLLKSETDLITAWKIITSREPQLKNLLNDTNWYKEKDQKKLVFEAIEWMDFYDETCLNTVYHDQKSQV